MDQLRLQVKARRGALTFSQLNSNVAVQLSALRDVEQIISRTARGLIEWYVEDLSVNGAYTIGLIPKLRKPTSTLSPTFTTDVTRAYVSQLRHVRERRDVPPMLSMSTVEQLEVATRNFVSGPIQAITAEDTASGTSEQIGAETHEVLRDLVMPAWNAIGSVTGRIDTIGRRPSPYATVYEELHGRAVRCEFGDALLDQVLAAFGRRVIGHGVMYYNSENRVTRVRLDSLEILPDDAVLPSMSSMAGRFPKLEHGRSVLLPPEAANG